MTEPYSIYGVVSDWLDHPLTEAGDPQAVAGRRLALPEGDRREELRRLGYNTPAHLAMFGPE